MLLIPIYLLSPTLIDLVSSIGYNEIMNSSYPHGRNLFGEDAETLRINVYHDESGTFGCSRWCLTGLLWSKDENERHVVSQMMQVRETHEYWDEIHYCELPSYFGGEYSVDARVARDWLNLYIGNLSSHLWFNVLAVDTHHPTYDAGRFTQDFHAYNRFTAITLYGGLKWHFPDESKLNLALFSDEKNTRPGGVLGDGITTDNFEDYVRTRLQADVIQDTRAPTIKFESPIKTISIPRKRKKAEIKAEEEMLQLCDLLVGSVYSAITMSSQVETKTWLGRTIAQLIVDSRQKPWEQKLSLHRRFSVSYFPNSRAEVYSDGHLAIMERQNQPRLFD